LELKELTANVRSTRGNSPARELRREGKIPAVLYGPKAETISLTIPAYDFENILKKGRVSQTIFNLLIQNGATVNKTAMIKELQNHPVSHKCLHVDFYEVSMDRKVTVSVPVATIGKSKGVDNGGMLEVILRELEITCFPQFIPDSIEIDITDLDMGDSLHAGDIELREGIEMHTDKDFTVVTIISPKAEIKAAEEGEEQEEKSENE
jgi:large subunit ribosomal protein L25